MPRDPIFVTDMMIAKSTGFVIATLNAPAGDLREGKIETLEIARVVMSLSTLAAITGLLQRTCQELGLAVVQTGGANDGPLERPADQDRRSAGGDGQQRLAKRLGH